MPPPNETAPLRGDWRRSEAVEKAWPDFSTARAPRTQAERLRRVTDDLAVIADWRDDLAARIARAELAFQVIGLSDERREALIHEARTFVAICQRYPQAFQGEQGS